MPIVLGLASSHAPSMFSPVEAWPQLHRILVRDVPQPRRIAEETRDVLQSYIARIDAAFATLRAQLEAASVDAVVIVGDDQTEVFSVACIPAFAIFVGAEVSGTTSITLLGQRPEDNHVTFKGHPELAHSLLQGLLDRGFDPAYLEKLHPLGQPKTGLGHAFTRIGNMLGLPERRIPTIPIFINGYHPPLPSAERCYAVGKALRQILADRPERVAIFGSGGLSHCPVGPRAGWVDEPLDRWVLERIEKGEGEKLRSLFTFDSDAMRSGTGEIRSWIAIAGAFDGRSGTVVDYIPAYHAVTGLGFAYWHAGD